MENPFDELTAALDRAREVQRAVERHSERMASLLVGNLRHVGRRYTLTKLKKELQNYNMHTGRWKD